MRKSFAAGVVAAALVGGAATTVVLGPVLANAQESDPATEDTAPEQPPWMTDALDQLVTDGVIDQGQADAVAEALQEARPGPPPWAGGPHGGGRGPGGPGHHGMMGRGLDTVAEAIGVDEQVVVDGLAAGQSLAEIAAANGSSAQAVIDALMAEANAHIDDEVAEGDMDAAEAEQHRAEVTERITAMVNGELPEGMGPGMGPGMGMGMGMGHGHGWGHRDDDQGEDTQDDDDATAPTTAPEAESGD